MKSEVAQFREQQQLEEESAQLGLFGSAAMANHQAIVTRMQQGAEVLVGLFKEGRDEEAFELWDQGILG